MVRDMACRRRAFAFPNPGTRWTRLDYSLRRDGHVLLEVFDALGRRVRTLRDGPDRAGAHSVAWNGRDDSGRRLTHGVYLARLEAGDSIWEAARYANAAAALATTGYGAVDPLPGPEQVRKLISTS